mgnify:CR=1 FL=1
MLLSVPATSANLGPGLDVLGLSLDFRNEFHIARAKETSVEILGEGQGVQRFLADNMFVKIFRKTLESIGAEDEARNEHFHFRFCNKITPAAVGGFTMSMLGTGADSGKVIYIKHAMPSYLRAVMVIPNRSTSTKYSRQTLPKKYSSHEVVFNMSHTSILCAAIMQEKWDMLALASRDKLHQERRMRQYPILFSVQKCALENGALMSTLSGSGSSFFNLCLADDMSHLLQSLQERFYRFRVVPMRLDNDGLIITDEKL